MGLWLYRWWFRWGFSEPSTNTTNHAHITIEYVSHTELPRGCPLLVTTLWIGTPLLFDESKKQNRRKKLKCKKLFLPSWYEYMMGCLIYSYYSKKLFLDIWSVTRRISGSYQAMNLSLYSINCCFIATPRSSCCQWSAQLVEKSNGVVLNEPVRVAVDMKDSAIRCPNGLQSIPFDPNKHAEPPNKQISYWCLWSLWFIIIYYLL